MSPQFGTALRSVVTTPRLSRDTSPQKSASMGRGELTAPSLGRRPVSVQTPENQLVGQRGLPGGHTWVRPGARYQSHRVRTLERIEGHIG